MHCEVQIARFWLRLLSIPEPSVLRGQENQRLWGRMARPAKFTTKNYAYPPSRNLCRRTYLKRRPYVICLFSGRWDRREREKGLIFNS